MSATLFSPRPNILARIGQRARDGRAMRLRHRAMHQAVLAFSGSYTTVPSNPFTVPGTVAGFLDIRKKASANGGVAGPVLTVAVPAYNGGGTTKRNLLIASGDSILRDTNSGLATGYTGGTGPGFFDVALSRLAFDNTWDTVNLGYAGKSPGWVLANKLDELLGYLDTSKYGQIIFLEAFTGGNGVSAIFNNSATQEVTDLKALAQQVKIKASFAKVVPLPYLNRTDGNAAADQDARRNAVNTNLQNDTSTFFDVKPLASSQQQIYGTNSPANSTYCVDGVHLTGSGGTNGKGGAGVLAEMAAQGIALAAGLTLSNPTYRANLDYVASGGSSSQDNASTRRHGGDGWTDQSDPLYSDGSGKYNAGASDRSVFCEETFYGSGFDIWMVTNAGGAPFVVLIDGVQQATGGTAKDSTTTASHVVYSITGLTLGKHTWRVVKTDSGSIYSDKVVYPDGYATTP